MTTKLDKAVAKYLFALDSDRPDPKDELAGMAWLDWLDRARFELLDHLIRRPRYRNFVSKHAWLNANNPHRPPYA